MSACRQATHRGRLWSNRHYPPSPKPAKALQIGVRVSRTCGQAIGTDCTGGCQRAARQHTEVGYGVIDITRPRPSRQKHCRSEFVSPEPVAKPLVLIALADVSVPPGNTPRSVME